MSCRAGLERVTLGRLPLQVSRLCLGTGTSGHGAESIQARGGLAAYLPVLLRAYSLGINFWDTSDNYGTQAHIREALRSLPREDLVLSTKIYAGTAQEARETVLACRKELAVERIDIMLLHEVDCLEELADKQPALQELHRLKGQGQLVGVGLSTHSIRVLEAAVQHPLIEVVFTNYNVANIHMDAGLSDYEAALTTAYQSGRGVYVHKTLGEGRLAERLEEALHHNLGKEFIHSVCVGFTREYEVEEAVRIALLSR